MAHNLDRGHRRPALPTRRMNRLRHGLGHGDDRPGLRAYVAMFAHRVGAPVAIPEVVLGVNEANARVSNCQPCSRSDVRHVRVHQIDGPFTH